MKLKQKIMRLITVMGILMMFGTMTAYAAGPGEGAQATEQGQGQVAQSDRWEGTGDTWKVRNQDGTGYLTNSWFLDNDGSWYMLGADGTMYSGIVTDLSTGKSYLLNPNHDGTFGKMLTQDGAYTINGQTLYLTFNQSHDGTYGAIQSGLSELRSIGTSEQSLSSVPTDSGTSTGNSTNSSLNIGSDTQSSTNSQSTISEEDRQWLESVRKDASQKLTVDPNANKGMQLHN